MQGWEQGEGNKGKENSEGKGLDLGTTVCLVRKLPVALSSLVGD